MSRTVRTVLIVVGVLAVAGGFFFAGVVYARANILQPSTWLGYGWNQTRAYGPGMMGNYVDNQQSTGTYHGPGMMNGYGMMGAYGGNRAANAQTTPLTVEQAQASAEKYLAAIKNPDLKIAEVMVFDNNAYVAVKESSTGIGAFELLVDPSSQLAYPEFGPNMMWNVKYSGLNHQFMMGGRGGMMGGAGGMMGGWGLQGSVPSNVSANMPVTKDQAMQDAQSYLDKNIAGATAADDPMQFYGYYTLDFEKDGKVVGMLSVNGYSGQVFLHTWHGTFVQEAQIQ